MTNIKHKHYRVKRDRRGFWELTARECGHSASSLFHVGQMARMRGRLLRNGSADGRRHGGARPPLQL